MFHEGTLDLERFRRLCRSCTETPLRMRPLTCSGGHSACGVVPPLAELDESFARAERARLEEQRLTALERRDQRDLELGRHAQLVPELEGLVREHPLRERLRGQLMLALSAAGGKPRLSGLPDRPSASRRELGLKPDDELQRLEKAILNHDPSLDSPIVSGSDDPLSHSVAERRHVPRCRSSRLGRRDRPAALPGRGTRARRPKACRRRDRARLGLGRQRRRSNGLPHPSGSPRSHQDDRNRSTGDRPRCRHRCGLGGQRERGTVSRIDPSADAVVETIDLRGSSELAWNPTYAVDADDDSVWIAAGPHHVFRIDPTTNEPSAIIDVGHVPVGVALGQEALWVVTTAERALRIEPHTNTARPRCPSGPRRVDRREAGCLGL